ncbi:SPFH domain / Band 7 family protein [Symmachiella macrocystis]|uniref:SPFH domain / Band 7 family protein n=1 Tax=Symmachiella macrocystis TaxID=2527985 RepID=A0A5C6BBZ9_9PLAN|nr:SPFH domain-containing protein [Symmachiella macrocystis]TWU09222.1 SPFH domain / Band 7 family protein [Symmachiella macrocystis]
MSEKRKFPQLSRSPWLRVVAFVAIMAIVGWSAFEWTVNRIYVEQGKLEIKNGKVTVIKPGQSLRLRYKGLLGSAQKAAPGQFAKKLDGGGWEVGVLEEMLGPGRHFYCPLWWDRTIVEDVVVNPGQVAIFTSKLGKELPDGDFLVDGELGETQYKGELRKVYGPGRYRVNDYAYSHRIVTGEEIKKSSNQDKHSGWVNIPTGYVGVVTNLTDNPITGAKAGIQEYTFPPGLYPVNPKEQEIDIIEIGLREKSIVVGKQRDQDGKLSVDESGEPIMASVPGGISFPSDDGFKIYMDFTAIWGLMPDQAPQAVSKFGNIEAVENKIVAPQIESICRNMGSQLGAVELLEGDSRQQFQLETSTAFRDALLKKNITLEYGLVRYIHIPQTVRVPIQQRYLADELKLTADQKQVTAQTEAELREAERQVELSAERVKAETAKLVAERIALGEKEAREIEAETLKRIAEIDKKTAELEAQATVLLGQANAEADQLLQEAKADKFGLAVAAFGSGDAYNKWVFATGLPDDIELNMLYAGEGTFWTDLKGFTATALGRQLQQSKKARPTTKPAVTRPAKR